MPHSSSPWGRRIGVALLVLLAAVFSFLNSGERVTMNVGFAMLYRVSLVGLVFLAFLLGMVSMFLFGLRQDRHVRAILQARNPAPPPPVRRSGSLGVDPETVDDSVWRAQEPAPDDWTYPDDPDRPM